MGNLISKILGVGVGEIVDSIGNTISKIDKSDVKLDLQLKYKELWSFNFYRFFLLFYIRYLQVILLLRILMEKQS